MPVRLALPAPLSALVALFALAGPVHAGPLDGLGTCTLTVSSTGTMTMAPNGQVLGSENNGGRGAAILLVGVNITPELIFSPPSVIGPPGWSASPTTMISVDTASGTHTGYSSDRLTVRPGFLIDTLTVHSRILSPTGFREGTYTARSTVTCQSAN